MIEIQKKSLEKVDGIQGLDALQNDLIHENLGKLDVKSEHKRHLAVMKKEIKGQIAEKTDENTEEQEDFVEDWRGTMEEVLPDLDNYIEDELLEKLKYLRLSYGFVWDKIQIKRLLIRSHTVFLRQSKEAKQNNGNKLDKKQAFLDIFNEQVLNKILTQLEVTESGIGDQEVFAMLLLLAEEYENLTEKEKKRLVFWLQKKIAMIKESKLLEVYEIQIAEDGTITIKGSMGGQKVTISYKPGEDVFDIKTL